MRALRYRAFGPIAEVLRIEQIDASQPAHNDVVVRARCAGINPLDWKLVEGQYRPLAKSRPPCGVASEFSGEVVRLGPGVTTLRASDRVVAWLNPFSEPPRALADEVCVAAAQCVRIPDALSFEHASVVTVAGLSALQMIERAAVRAGQRVLVHGAAGGVGSFAVPMLRDRGAFVVATGSATSQAFLRELAPDLQVDYATDPATWPGPFDAILDCASRLPTALLPRLLPHGGAYVATLPSFPGVIVDPLFNVFRQRRRHALRLEPAAAQLAQMLAMVAEGRVPVRISRVVSFDRVLDALAESRGGHAHGKLVVAIG